MIERAKELRKSMTNAEKALWHRLRDKQILNLKFRRQHPVDIFIADFYCHSIKLIIEVDGKVHDQRIIYDTGRTAELERFGIKVIRFTNQQILNEMKMVTESIRSTCERMLKEKGL